MVSFVAPLFAWAGLAASFLLGLAAVIRMAGPAAGVGSPSGVIRLPREVTGTVITLFALAAAVFLTHLVRRGWSRRQPGEDPPEGTGEARRVPTWVRAVRQIAGFLYFVALAYALSRGGVSLDLLSRLVLIGRIQAPPGRGA